VDGLTASNPDAAAPPPNKFDQIAERINAFRESLDANEEKLDSVLKRIQLDRPHRLLSKMELLTSDTEPYKD
jgi:hypothetical protein